MTKQVHVFGSLGAPAPPLRRICNPTVSSISICNALINKQETKNIFTHLKCLYSLRLDYKSNRARNIQPSKGHQVHPLRRICNPTASSISICNALKNKQETKNIFTHLKCLYSLRLDCKSNRARSLGAPVFVTQRNRRNRRNRRKQEKASCVRAHIRTQERFLKNYCYYCYSVTKSPSTFRICKKCFRIYKIPHFSRRYLVTFRILSNFAD